MKRLFMAALLAGAALGVSDCATDVAGAGVYYGAYYYDDPWYYGPCCADYPDGIGPPPPHPEHPIANPPGGAEPSNPIAKPPGGSEPSRPTTQPTRSMPSPRSAAMPRGGGGGRGGGRR